MLYEQLSLATKHLGSGPRHDGHKLFGGWQAILFLLLLLLLLLLTAGLWLALHVMCNLFSTPFNDPKRYNVGMHLDQSLATLDLAPPQVAGTHGQWSANHMQSCRNPRGCERTIVDFWWVVGDATRWHTWDRVGGGT